MQIMSGNSENFVAGKKYCLVKPVIPNPVEESKSGIVIGLSKTLMDSRPVTGTIISIGENSEYNKGDTVVFPSTDGLDFKFDDGQFLILKIESLIGKMQK